MPSRALQEIVEYRGVEGLVAAEILTDNDDDGYTFGDVFAIAGVANPKPPETVRICPVV